MMIIQFDVKHFQVRLGEWLASAILTSIGFGLIVAFPHMMYGNSFFNAMLTILPQFAWGALFLLCGVPRLVALWINGRKRVTPYIRMALAFISCFMWFEFLIGLMLSRQPSTGWFLYPWLLVLDMYNVFRSAADAREVFEIKRAGNNGTYR